jgi:hypothetical protein
MRILIVVYLWDLLIISTTGVVGQQQLRSQTFDITIGKCTRVGRATTP